MIAQSARSAVRGIKTLERINFLCAFVTLQQYIVMDEIATKNDKISKPTIGFVRASPTGRDPDVNIDTSKIGRRRIKSPRGQARGQTKTRPTAYL